MAVISDAHRFVYFGAPKTGTSTVTRVLKSLYAGRHVCGYHSSSVPAPAEYLAWATVRNPWTRLLSWWHAWTHSRRAPADPVQGCTFPVFIAFLTDNREGADLPENAKRMRSPQNLFMEHHPCTKSVRLEHLAEDFAALPFGKPESFGRQNPGCWEGGVTRFYDDPAIAEAIRYGVVEECVALGYPTEIPE